MLAGIVDNSANCKSIGIMSEKIILSCAITVKLRQKVLFYGFVKFVLYLIGIVAISQKSIFLCGE
ncbi:hypothetical protein D3C78_193350 [compost metagenome]